MNQEPEQATTELKRTNTRKHWALYALDAYEAKHGREEGATPKDIYELGVSGSDGIEVFTDWADAGTPLSEAVKDGLVQNRSVDSEWGTIIHAYRLSEAGQQALRRAGKPTKLPRRHDPDHDRELPREPTHEIQGGPIGEPERDEHWLVGEGPDEWVETPNERVYFRNEADAGSFSGASGDVLAAHGAKVAKSLPDFTVVITCGPYRLHDVQYRVDVDTHRINLDYYSVRPGIGYTDDVIRSIVTDLRRVAKERENDDA